MAAGLQVRGVAAGDHFAILGPTTRALVCAIEATWLAGATVVMLPLPMRMASLEGFIDRSMSGHSGFSYYETWNDHTIRAIEPRRVKFTLSAEFTEANIGEVTLNVDEVEEITLLTPLAER